MSTDLLDRYLEAMAPTPTAIQQEMADRAQAEGFPYIGPVNGGVLYQLVELTDATRIFEFGSGFGYSASWFARGLDADGRIVLTEEDPDELDDAQAYLERAGVADRCVFEAGDAIETIERYADPFDIVLIDIAKELYLDAFEAVRDQVPPGGVIVADNAISAGPMDTEGLMAHLTDDGGEDLDEMTAGMAAYLGAVRSDDAFLTTVLPVGSGLALSVRLG